MILQGNQRGGARDLAQHLLSDENEHVEIHELRGFISDNLPGALDEIRAVARGTRTKKYLYSLSLNPPPDQQVSTEQFEHAISKAEKALGLKDQARAVVFHIKDNRRHCHVVWSRIDEINMKAIPMYKDWSKLMAVSQDLYLHHGWPIPKGFLNKAHRDPKNFTLAQWQQAKRIGKDPRKIKQDFQECWASSDTQKSFAAALKERGYHLAKGDRRAFVALDRQCEVYAIAKWTAFAPKMFGQKSTRQRIFHRSRAHARPSPQPCKPSYNAYKRNKTLKSKHDWMSWRNSASS